MHDLASKTGSKLSTFVQLFCGLGSRKIVIKLGSVSPELSTTEGLTGFLHLFMPFPDWLVVDFAYRNLPYLIGFNNLVVPRSLSRIGLHFQNLVTKVEWKGKKMKYLGYYRIVKFLSKSSSKDIFNYNTTSVYFSPVTINIRYSLHFTYSLMLLLKFMRQRQFRLLCWISSSSPLLCLT